MKSFVLVRHTFGPTSTVGTLYLRGEAVCFTLEDADRLALGFKKVYAQTAIPAGTFDLRLSMSSRFRKIMPEVMGVPQFTGIRIHSGNFVKDTAGCILPGRQASLGVVHFSREAYETVLDLIEEEIDRYQATSLTIVRLPMHPELSAHLGESWKKAEAAMT